jgi:RNA polymerase sigma-70 factor (ECF subfamily)
MGLKDEELVNLCLSGDKDAFGELVMRYQNIVYGLAYRLSGNFEDAKDLSQEAFIRTYTRLSDLREKAKFASWLKKVTFSVCMNWLKTQKRSDFTLLEKEINEEYIYDIPDPAPLPSEQIEMEELRETVLKAINKLPETYRLPLTLFHFDGLSYQKVAEFLDLPLSTVKWRLHQARKQLKKEMAGMIEKPETRFDWIGLELHIAGCPNACRHCKDEGSPPCGELMSFDDAKWVVEQFRNLTKSEPPVAKNICTVLYHEPTAHPDFLSLWQYHRDICEAMGCEEFPECHSVLSTNGYGIARADDYRQMLKRLRELGIRMISSTLHGLEEHHDWFVRRKGAFRDIFLSAERAREAGFQIHFNGYLDRRNMKDFARHDIICEAGFEEKSQYKISLPLPVPTFVVGKRLRDYELSLRPRLSDFESLPSEWKPFLELSYDRYTEGSWVKKILNDPTDPSLKEGFSDISDGEGCFILAIDRFFDVYQRPYNFDWPPVKHGNLKTDGLAAILDRMEAWRPPKLPDLATLAERYGDINSTLIHRNAFSVRNKWLDSYWRDKEKEGKD